jgi:glycosyltransferase involved in cell wall biosynthesis
VRVHQITYATLLGDAISNHILEIDACLRNWGYETAIYAEHIAPELQGVVQPDLAYMPHLNETEDLLIYHYSIYSPNIRLFRATRGRKILIYHNITPAHFFTPWDENLALLCENGRLALRWLTECDLALGDSDYNRRELVEIGVPAEKTGVLPIFLSQEKFETVTTDHETLNYLTESDDVNWLTVGRVAPNKAIHELIRLFYVYHHLINPRSKLHIVGSRYPVSYNAYLDKLVTELDLRGQVHFLSHVSMATLKAYYQGADLYVAASHHEGFCVPLVESMYFNLPILAHKSTAIPETLGDSGVLYEKMDYHQVAEMAQLMVKDQDLRQKIIVNQQERLHQLRPAEAERILKQYLTHLSIFPKS